MLMTQHITEDELELYTLGHLSHSEAGVVEQHLLVCEQCRNALRGVEETIQTIRDALRNDQENGG